MYKAKKLVGQKFGRLTVIERDGTSKNGCSMWLCECECGTRKVVMGVNLTNGRTKSCGCLLSEKVKESNRKRAINKRSEGENV